MLLFFLSAVTTISTFMLLGAISGRKLSGGADYSVAGRSAGSVAVLGMLIGALVGGASTVGTVQMAYRLGISACWFTLGGGIGCLILGLWFARPLRTSGLETIPQFLEGQYGRSTSFLSMTAASLGTFISIVAQFLAGTALFRSVFPLGITQASLLLAVIILGFIFMGGLRSFSAVGKLKIVLLYFAMIACAIAAWRNGPPLGEIVRTLPAQPFFNPFGIGLGKGLGALTSLVVGIFCTQIYIQALFAASDAATARRGALLSALLMPPVGFLGIFVGLSMKASGLEIDAAQALPLFIRMNFHPVLSGILWGGIFITVIGCAAGLSLGIATNLVRDFYLPLFGRNLDERGILCVSRIAVSTVVLLAAGIGMIGKGSMILQWSYLSLGLRGAGTFFPLVVGILLPGTLPRHWALAATAGGLLAVLVWPMTGLPGQPLFAGLALSLLLTLAGMAAGRAAADRP